MKPGPLPRVMGTNGPAGRTASGEHARVLLLVRPFTVGAGEACLDLVADGMASEDALLFVLGSRTLDDQLRALRAHVDGPLPSRIGFLTFEDGGRSAAGATRGSYDVDGDVWVQAASSPGNLTDIGVALSKRLSEWAEDGSGVAVCFEPVTTLLQYSSVRDVYRFMHVFGQQVRAVDGRVHFHVDPTAHDQMVVNQLKTLCDAVVELDLDGDATVQAR